MKKTKEIILALALLLLPEFAMAALPPGIQNMKDLDVMVAYVREHPDVAATLTAIDLQGRTVYYGEGCKAVFERKTRFRLPGWTGPAEPLEFRESICPAQ